MSEFLDKIECTRDYLNYLETHYNNVQKAWKLIQERCSDFRFIYDDYVFFTIDAMIKNHDMSKLEKDEFTQYRRRFYPTCTEEGDEVLMRETQAALAHHIRENPHHIQNWTSNIDTYANPFDAEIYCVEMVVDWVAISFNDGNSTARSFFEKNNYEKLLEPWAVKLVNAIFDRLDEVREYETMLGRVDVSTENYTVDFVNNEDAIAGTQFFSGQPPIRILDISIDYKSGVILNWDDVKGNSVSELAKINISTYDYIVHFFKKDNSAYMTQIVQPSVKELYLSVNHKSGIILNWEDVKTNFRITLSKRLKKKTTD